MRRGLVSGLRLFSSVADKAPRFLLPTWRSVIPTSLHDFQLVDAENSMPWHSKKRWQSLPAQLPALNTEISNLSMKMLRMAETTEIKKGDDKPQNELLMNALLVLSKLILQRGSVKPQSDYQEQAAHYLRRAEGVLVGLPLEEKSTYQGELTRLWGVYHQENNDSDQAVAVLRQQASFAPEAAEELEALQLAALVKVATGDYQAALKILNEAEIASEKNSWESDITRSFIHLAGGQVNEAQQALSAAREHPETRLFQNALCHYNSAIVASQSGDSDGVSQSYAHAIASLKGPGGFAISEFIITKPLMPGRTIIVQESAAAEGLEIGGMQLA